MDLAVSIKFYLWHWNVRFIEVPHYKVLLFVWFLSNMWQFKNHFWLAGHKKLSSRLSASPRPGTAKPWIKSRMVSSWQWLHVLCVGWLPHLKRWLEFQTDRSLCPRWVTAFPFVPSCVLFKEKCCASELGDWREQVVD